MFDYRTIADSELKSYFKGIPFSLSPRRHQLITFAHMLGQNANRIQMFHGIGTGKTLSALWTISEFWKPERTLVVCPRAAFRAWKRDVREIGWKYCILEGTAAERKDMLCDESVDIFCINYEGLKSVYANLEKCLVEDDINTLIEAQKVADECKGIVMIDDEHPDHFIVTKSSGWIVDPGEFQDGFDCMIFDEVHKCKDIDSLQSEICYSLSWRADYAIGMTGTPISSSLLDLWPTMRVVDLGQSLGQNFYKFKQRYFQKVGWGDWINKYDTESKVLNQILPFATSFTRNECIDLPPSEWQEREVNPTLEQYKLMEQIIRGLQIDINGGVINTENVLTRTESLRQIAGGFFYSKKDGKRIVTKFENNPKLGILDDVIDEHDGKIIIFHEYPPEGEIIEAWAEKNNLTYASLRGDTKDKDAEESYFIDDPNCDLLIANATVGGESLDLTTSCIEIFYSHSASIIKREQAEGRISRSGQNKLQLFIDAMLRNSPDEALVGKMGDRRAMSKRMLSYIRNFGKKK
jgi:SNF2 family DNA or RNA helicase